MTFNDSSLPPVSAGGCRAPRGHGGGFGSAAGRRGIRRRTRRLQPESRAGARGDRGAGERGRCPGRRRFRGGAAPAGPGEDHRPPDGRPGARRRRDRDPSDERRRHRRGRPHGPGRRRSDMVRGHREGGQGRAGPAERVESHGGSLRLHPGRRSQPDPRPLPRLRRRPCALARRGHRGRRTAACRRGVRTRPVLGAARRQGQLRSGHRAGIRPVPGVPPLRRRHLLPR